MVYRKHNGGSWELESAEFDGGRFLATASSSSGVSGRNCTPYYQLADHLGSVRTVFTLSDGLAQIVAQNDYYPFGLRHASDVLSHGSSTDNRYLFNGKEAQVLGRLGLLDYGARMYDPLTGRWFNVDPLAKLYYGISPFVYCANNPVKFVDQDGRKIYFATGVSKEFKEKFAATVKYMNEKETSGDIAALEKSENIYYISKGESGGFDASSNTVYWNPNEVIMTNNGIVLFPSTVLAHEIKHGRQKDEMEPRKFEEQNRPDDNNLYDKKLEEDVIKTTEQTAAKKHGDIKDGETTRTDHGGKSVIVNNNLPSDQILENRRSAITSHVKNIIK